MIIFFLIGTAYVSSNRSEVSFFGRNVRILFVGDMFFDRQIRTVMDQKGGDFVFSCIHDYLNSFDTVVGNLEGPITANDSVSLGSEVGSPQNFIFTFPQITAKLLKQNNIHIVSLGNNHINNFGRDGIKSTHKALSSTNVEYFGGIRGDEPILRKEIGGIKFSFIAYNQFGGQSVEEVSKEIKKESEAGHRVIVFAHWGEEYSGATPQMKEAARTFAKSGASLIIGAHPHVILAQEKIGESEVFYSLGNFIFDQYWTPEVSTGMGVEAVFKNNSFKSTSHRFEIKRDGQTCKSS